MISKHLLGRAKQACSVAPNIIKYIILIDDSKECYPSDDDEERINLQLEDTIIMTWDQLLLTPSKRIEFLFFPFYSFLPFLNS